MLFKNPQARLQRELNELRRRQPASDRGRGPIGAETTVPAGAVDPATGDWHPFAFAPEGAGTSPSLWLPLADSLLLFRGAGAMSFTRATTTTRLDADGNTDAVAVNQAAFDWVQNAGGDFAGWSRYALRADHAGQLLTVPTAGNVSHVAGGFSLWARTTWAANAFVRGGWLMRPPFGLYAPGAAERILLESGTWKLYRPATKAALWFVVPLSGGGTVTLTYDLHGTYSGRWLFVACDWDATTVRLWVNGVLVDTETPLASAPAAFGATLGIGQGVAAGLPWGGYLVDVRGWGGRLSPGLIEALWAVKA